MMTFLLVVHALIATALVIVILMQRSEGGGLGVGGSSAGLMTARGAADFLTRSTSILATMFVAMSLIIAAVASLSRDRNKVDLDAVKAAGGAAPTAPAAPVPSGMDGLTIQPAQQTAPNSAPAQPAKGDSGVPLAK